MTVAEELMRSVAVYLSRPDAMNKAALQNQIEMALEESAEEAIKQERERIATTLEAAYGRPHSEWDRGYSAAFKDIAGDIRIRARSSAPDTLEK